MFDKRALQAEMLSVLQDNILAFWLDKMVDTERGGFYGRMTPDGRIEADAPKGAILNARILWAFSAAYRATGREDYLAAATRAKRYLVDRFYDHEHGGVYWSLTADGAPLDTKKQFYALGFAIYGLSEYVRATGDEEALHYAVALYDDIEQHSRDRRFGGYIEALTRDWQPIDDMRLSAKDRNDRKSMNTHLHIIEPYTNLLRVWRNDELLESVCGLLDIFEKHIIDPETFHLRLFFDDEWHSTSDMISYGHDIEASWLLHETALVIGDPALIEHFGTLARRIADAAAEGLQPDGSMIYEYDAPAAHRDTDRHWWVEAECVVGYFNLWEHFGDSLSLERSLAAWSYIKDHLIDRSGGEWWWSVDDNGNINRRDDKAGFWKCPYHNSRMCLFFL
ncbi:MAG: AGE family epimerase/isomerase [Alistipes sp.]|nr:AGE family epimerase/isomerase [Alistipes sp.]